MATKDRLIVLRLLQPIEPAISNALCSLLSIQFNIECQLVDQPLDLSMAWQSTRQQYQAMPILAQVKAQTSAEVTAILAIVDVDIYLPELNFIFGFAEVGVQAGLISLARLRQTFYQQPDDQKLLLTRASKEALHEIGHIFGLTHCSLSSCVMYLSHTLLDTDAKRAAYCPDCLHSLAIHLNS